MSAAGDAALDLTHGLIHVPARGCTPLTGAARAWRCVRRSARAHRPRSVLRLRHRAGRGASRRRARLGSDLSPLAVLVARAKCAVDVAGGAGGPPRRGDLRSGCSPRAARARRAGGPRGRRLPDDVWRAFPPHVAAELAALRDGAEAEPGAARARRSSRSCPRSSWKVSHRESGSCRTRPRRVSRRARRGRALVRGARRGARPGPAATRARGAPGSAGAGGPRRRRATARRGPPAHGRGGRDLAALPGDVRLTPDQQALRLAFLGMEARAGCASGEIGAPPLRRRAGGGGARGLGARHDRRCSASSGTRSRREAPIALVIGDSRVGQGSEARAVFADEALGRIAPVAGLRVVAAASQRRTALGESRAAGVRAPAQTRSICCTWTAADASICCTWTAAEVFWSAGRVGGRRLVAPRHSRAAAALAFAPVARDSSGNGPRLPDVPGGDAWSHRSGLGRSSMSDCRRRRFP